jgi:hypothetical protein
LTLEFHAYCSCATITLGFCGLRRGHRTSQPTTTLKTKPPVDSADCAPDCTPKSVYAQGQTSRTGNCFTEMSIILDKRSPPTNAAMSLIPRTSASDASFMSSRLTENPLQAWDSRQQACPPSCRPHLIIIASSRSNIQAVCISSPP